MSRYIDADALTQSYQRLCSMITCTECPMYNGDGNECEIYLRVKNAPSIDIVRCQDCKHWVYNFNGCARNPLMKERENLLTRILKRLGLIVEYEVSKEDMCKQAQSICNHDCEHCAWQTERSE